MGDKQQRLDVEEPPALSHDDSDVDDAGACDVRGVSLASGDTTAATTIHDDDVIPHTEQSAKTETKPNDCDVTQANDVADVTSDVVTDVDATANDAETTVAREAVVATREQTRPVTPSKPPIAPPVKRPNNKKAEAPASERDSPRVAPPSSSPRGGRSKETAAVASPGGGRRGYLSMRDQFLRDLDEKISASWDPFERRKDEGWERLLQHSATTTAIPAPWRHHAAAAGRALPPRSHPGHAPASPRLKDVARDDVTADRDDALLGNRKRTHANMDDGGRRAPSPHRAYRPRDGATMHGCGDSVRGEADERSRWSDHARASLETEDSRESWEGHDDRYPDVVNHDGHYMRAHVRNHGHEHVRYNDHVVAGTRDHYGYMHDDVSLPWQHQRYDAGPLYAYSPAQASPQYCSYLPPEDASYSLVAYVAPPSCNPLAVYPYPAQWGQIMKIEIQLLHSKLSDRESQVLALRAKCTKEGISLAGTYSNDSDGIRLTAVETCAGARNFAARIHWPDSTYLANCASHPRAALMDSSSKAVPRNSCKRDANANWYNDSSETKSAEVDRLKQAMETMMATNEEKDRIIEELKKTIHRYRKVNDVIVQGHKKEMETVDPSILSQLQHLQDGSSPRSSIIEADSRFQRTPSPRFDASALAWPTCASSHDGLRLAATPERVRQATPPPGDATDKTHKWSTPPSSLTRAGQVAPSGVTMRAHGYQLPNGYGRHSKTPPPSARLAVTVDTATAASHSAPHSPAYAAAVAADHQVALSAGNKSASAAATQPAGTVAKVTPTARPNNRQPGAARPRSYEEMQRPPLTPPQSRRHGSDSASRRSASTMQQRASWGEVHSNQLARQSATFTHGQQPVMKSPHKELKGLRKLFSRKRRSSEPITEALPSRPLSALDPQQERIHYGVYRSLAPPAVSYYKAFRHPELDVPFSRWDADQVALWMHTMGLSQYVGSCRAWLRDGEQLLQATTQDLVQELGIQNPLHRKKLQLALQAAGSEEDSPASELDYQWVTTWLGDVGLPQYKDVFNSNRVDGRMLNYLTIVVLNNPREVMMWTNHRVMEWLRSVNLSEYAPNLRGSGVHGALIVMESRFTADLLAQLLSIPPSKTLLRRHLSTHFSDLVGVECLQMKRDSESRTEQIPLTPAMKIKVTYYTH
ncbi:PREDICTED: uncharacterized protein LOC106813798 [Priapulus caudatus]|uniref:Uncharacterized protein LOC106813798 n=1 Tax=Priapulus caudatus TaxID=37621 RepID=A0ABM1EMT8_PRICU|nr:PREDICTED: uncharacterized protein LOC106813798 [Priapulus caudatus]